MLLIIIVFLSCFCNAAICFFSSPFSDVTSFKTVFFSLAVLPVKLFLLKSIIVIVKTWKIFL